MQFLRRFYLWAFAERFGSCEYCSVKLTSQNRINFPFDRICETCYFDPP